MSALGGFCCKPKKNDPEEEEDQMERSEWSKPIQFILSIIGYAVGLGNIWRFPYLVLTNGGGMYFLTFPALFMYFALSVILYILVSANGGKNVLH